MDRTYDLFGKLSGGSLLWKNKLTGLNEALARLQELGSSSSNEHFVMHLPSKAVVARVNAPAIGSRCPMQHIAVRLGVPLGTEIETKYIWKRTMWCRHCDKVSYDFYAPKMEQEPELVEKHEKYLRTYIEKHCPDHSGEIITPEQL
ncbi:MAG: hypothetical protein WBE86_00480 [Candidatus Acidiferrales bacterium]